MCLKLLVSLPVIFCRTFWGEISRRSRAASHDPNSLFIDPCELSKLSFWVLHNICVMITQERFKTIGGLFQNSSSQLFLTRKRVLCRYIYCYSIFSWNIISQTSITMILFHNIQYILLYSVQLMETKFWVQYQQMFNCFLFFE